MEGDWATSSPALLVFSILIFMEAARQISVNGRRPNAVEDLDFTKIYIDF